MSSTMAVELEHVRRLMGDRKLGSPAVPGSLLEELMGMTMDELSRNIGAGDIVQTGFATVGPTSTTVTVSGSYPAMRHLKHLVRESDGKPLSRCSYSLILHNRQYGGGNYADPYQFALVPGPDETVLLEVYPTPSSSISLTGVWEPVPSAVTPLAGNIYLEPSSLVALRARVAARALASLPQDQLAALGKSQQHIDNLNAMADRAEAEEWHRMNAAGISDHIERVSRRG